VTVGGGGRFLLLHFRRSASLAFFDVMSQGGRVSDPRRGERSHRGRNEQTGASLSGSGVLQRYDLLTRKSEKERWPERKCSASAWGLPRWAGAAQWRELFHLLDLNTLRSLELPAVEDRKEELRQVLLVRGHGTGVRLTNAGRFAQRHRHPDPGAPALRYQYEHDSGWFIIPAPTAIHFVGVTA